MSPRWSTARVTAIASALAIGGSAFVATPALADGGDADASALAMKLSLELVKTPLLEVDAVAGSESPPGEQVIPDLAAYLGELKGAGASGSSTLTTVSDESGTSSSAVVDKLSVSVLGVEAVAAEQVSATAQCLPGALPTGETSAQAVEVLGKPLDLATVPVEGEQVTAAATIPGMTSAELVAKVRPGSVSANASTADAVGMSVNLTLKGTVPEVGAVASIWLGSIVVGEAGCEHQEDPGAPALTELLPAEGLTTGGDTITLKGSGFTADTTVEVGGEKATDVVVVSGSELTFVTPPGAVGSAAVTVTTPSGRSGELAFSYVEPAPEEPVVEAIDPDETVATGGEEIHIFGSGFVRDRTSVTIGTTTVSPSNVEVPNSGMLVLRAPAQAAGVVPLSVTTPVGTSGTMDLTYLPAGAPPVITSISPDTGPIEGGGTITLKGTGFVPNGTMVTMGSASFLDDDVTVVSDTELSFLAPPDVEGEVSVDVTTVSGTSNPVVYNYVATTPPPTGGIDGHDFDGDGNVDVLARDRNGGLWLYPGNGAGGWLKKVQVGTGWNTMNSMFGPGDFNGDEKADVIARDSRGGLWLYPGNGAGGWLKKVQVGTGWNSMNSIVGPGDFNGDTNVDVLARDQDGRLWLFTGNGAGGWLKKSQVGSGWQTMNSIFGPGDFNGDGSVDVMARDRNGGLWLYPGNGAGGWLKRVQAGTGWNSMNSIVGPGDFDGDNNVDVLARDRNGGLWLFTGNGAGGWLKKTQAGSGWNTMTSIF
ncbi:hypothetical protein GC088_08355 [Arthrobacter sp. JZ12]|uniref:IPT/TIG domain-containing protein n=1 Tax=Arthrobacter sp. JZ12 TaxID=2654190 RepID=UPI002B489B05|nr:IPT/TIG domain-containing protein [Arthrobacter sp. JZ12]WRH25076.1 hypothetical protein GC088_08355 [Arthrobacter sp. JZ12]